MIYILYILGLTWKLFGHHKDTAKGENHSAHREANNETRATRNDDDLAQNHKYPNDKHTQHIGSVDGEKWRQGEGAGGARERAEIN